MSSYRSLRLGRVEDVRRVVIHNPRTDVNTVVEELHAQPRQLFAEPKREVEAGAVVLTGHGQMTCPVKAPALAKRLAARAPLALRYPKLAVRERRTPRLQGR